LPKSILEQQHLPYSSIPINPDKTIQVKTTTADLLPNDGDFYGSITKPIIPENNKKKNQIYLMLNGLWKLMDQICDNCGKTVEGLVKVSGPKDSYTFAKSWCFACVYDKGLRESNSRKTRNQ